MTSNDFTNSYTVAFLGSANWDLIALNFVSIYNQYVKQDATLLSIPFGQYRNLLADESSDLRRSNLDLYIFCERFEDFYEPPFSYDAFADNNTSIDKINEYIQLIKFARNQLPGQFFVLDFAPVRSIQQNMYCCSDDNNTVSGFVGSLNTRLREQCKEVADCHVVNLSSLVMMYGARNADPGKYWHIGRIAYNAGFGEYLNQKIVGMILALRGETARVLILDLDNTLWGGVIGDDGVKGIKLGGDFPGSVFVEFQKSIVALKNNGLILSICSKNTEEIAIEAINIHPCMVLKLDDFATVKINWNDKKDNIKKIAEEIGVSLSAVCLIDDSPYERSAVRQLLPMVIVPELPDDYTKWTEFLFNYPYLTSLYLTQEDLERNNRQKIRSRIQMESMFYDSKEDYLRSLQMTLYFHPLNAMNTQRVLQLIAKTNQFNMTTKRYSESDLFRLKDDNYKIIAIGLSDKYSTEEIVGVIIFQLPINTKSTVIIDTFILSCRVLGRTIEKGILGWLCSYMRLNGYNLLEGKFNKTPRNLPASTVYTDNGFTDDNNGTYLLDIRNNEILIPDWFDVEDENNESSISKNM